MNIIFQTFDKINPSLFVEYSFKNSKSIQIYLYYSMKPFKYIKDDDNYISPAERNFILNNI